LIEKLVKGQLEIAEIDPDKLADPFSPILFLLLIKLFDRKREYKKLN
jgi:hypothetical protein